jgi:hypothetical protein
MRIAALSVTALLLALPSSLPAQAWRNCAPGSYAPGGCESYAPGGGKSYAPGGGQSYGPSGGNSYGPNGGQSYGPNGGRSLGPGGGLAPNRNWRRGLDPNTLRPAPGGVRPLDDDED